MKNNILTLNSVISRAENVLDCTVDNAMVLMSVTSGDYINLNAQASAIWSVISEAQPVSVIVEKLLAQFEVELEDCQQQTLAFLNTLKQENLIEIT
jgi:hypothetical protein